MKKPNIPARFTLQHEFDDEPSFIVDADDVETVLAEVPPLDGKYFNPAARAIAALPALLEALEDAIPGLASDILYCERHPDACEPTQQGMLAHKRSRLENVRAALTAAGYTL